MKLLAFAGSTREDSCNKKLVRAAAALADVSVWETEVIDLRDVPLPLYDGDLEEKSGLPRPALELKKKIHEADALLIASPEYNASVSGVLKNTIDWLSRSGGDADPGAVLNEKPVALLSASPGGLGGIRGLNHLRAILQNLNAWVIPAQYALGGAYQAFDEAGKLIDPDQVKAVTAVLDQLVRAVRK